MTSRSPTPPATGSSPDSPGTPGIGSLPSFKLGYFSAPFEKFARDENFVDWQSAFTLVDTIETFWDSRVDLFERNLKRHSEKIKLRAEDILRRTKTPTGELVARDLEREVDRFKAKISNRMSKLAAAWQSTKAVRTMEKVSFLLGVHTVLVSALLFGLAPQYIHVVFTVLSILLLPARAYEYKRKAWHYFLFDLCYYVNVLTLVFLWILPNSPVLWVTCYCLSHGSLASAVITWRNSLVFHDWEKVTSVFIHVYPPFVFTVLRHFYPGAEKRFPAIQRVPHLEPFGALFLSGLVYMIWQGLYWKFVLINRKKKIESGQRLTSFSFLLHDKRGIIGRKLSTLKPENREWSFMVGQLVYAIVTELPAVFLLYDSPFWSGAFMLFIFTASVWNGAGFYIEVFGRKFERELEALRKELASAALHGSSSRTTPTLDTASLTSEPGSFSDAESVKASHLTDTDTASSSPTAPDTLGLEELTESKKDQ
ncbi:hypothetical protein BKA62DRAFT_705856 [Auriculariales sp. MPI-PUGE-AT-0066]|nr:hypothetical protein BKA62DRAFT_705856 [Auriculariales sp. MPI-PUGE-AT-0066]